MKKVLFGIMALSIAAFAANPGTDSEASVPVKVIAEIITAPTGLTITDEAGTVIDELLLDHGRIVKGAATSDSVAYKLFKVQRFDGTKPTKIGAGTLNVKLDEATTTLAKNGTSTASTLTSALTLTGGATQVSSKEYTHTTGADDTEHVGRVTSTIAKTELLKTGIETGIHHNSRERTLTVVYTPAKPTEGGK
ncbi:hypothetical protein MKD34_01510 [Cetobacterium somerae]|uniref:hypothetical protein n=1 Tax=Cetobacterium somerae TaxID=188913 RepID=UPI001F06F54A|nr:hypothetical protein [Cetobacterium somerae]UPO97548.1 hypothetical protein MKD34_01510 [Cetobacterium somerae]